MPNRRDDTPIKGPNEPQRSDEPAERAMMLPAHARERLPGGRTAPASNSLRVAHRLRLASPHVSFRECGAAPGLLD
jgi:hypothetical protein